MGVNTTLSKIHQIATEEFLKNGFRGASLREIVKKAGVTTGAFYGYYKSKEELFDAIVKPHADFAFGVFNSYMDRFRAFPKKDWAAHMDDFSAIGMMEVYEYASEHPTQFKLLLRCSEGTQWENFIHRIVAIEEEVTHDFYAVIKEQGFTPYILNPTMEHMIISGEVSAFFELILHEIPKEEGIRCVKELHDFYKAAWSSVLKLD